MHEAAVPATAQGKVLSGPELRDQVVNGEASAFIDPNPFAPHYPGGIYPAGPPGWRNIDGLAASRVVRTTDAEAGFNDEDALYRIAFHLSHYGGMPDRAGDLNGDGVDDLIMTDHFAYVDGERYAGEVDLYFGRRGRFLEPRRQEPDVVFYGDEAGAKLGLSVAPAGDVNGDGWDDLLMSAGFHSVGEGAIANAGRVYLVYGGFLQRFRCPVKVRVEDIGRTIPGLSFDGGYDGGRYVAWANGLEAGDFNGDALGDIVIGSYDPYPGSGPAFAASYLRKPNAPYVSAWLPPRSRPRPGRNPLNGFYPARRRADPGQFRLRHLLRRRFER